MVINPPPHDSSGEVGRGLEIRGTQGLGRDADTDPGRGCY